ncbi:MAG: short-subunit dehydrogenase [Myxococcota bacterium]|jgi:short-subunit dehydrogenase
MRPPVDNGVVILTGASSGIGEAMAKLLAKKAGVLVLVARRQERLEALAASLSGERAAIMVLPCDLTDEAATGAMVSAVESAHGQVDVLINNAGLGDIGLFSASSWEKNRRMIDVNITALLFLTHRVLPGMVARGRGGILNVSSGFGLTWMPIFSAYVASKHFVSSFSESLRTELSGTGVVVTQLCPGPVATEFEQIAGNPTGQDVPAFIQITADQCARSAIAGFMRGRAVIVPGFLAYIGISLGRLTPSWVLRLLYAPAGRILRRQVKSGE